MLRKCTVLICPTDQDLAVLRAPLLVRHGPMRTESAGAKGPYELQQATSNLSTNTSLFTVA